MEITNIQEIKFSYPKNEEDDIYEFDQFTLYDCHYEVNKIEYNNKWQIKLTKKIRCKYENEDVHVEIKNKLLLKFLIAFLITMINFS